jgi:hypothetical protein
MDAESFNALALRVISREATDDERRALEAELAATPAHREEFEQLKVTHEILRTTSPMAQATHALGPELPAHRVGELRTAVRQHFGPATNREKTLSAEWRRILRWLFAGSGIGALGFAVLIFCFANRSIEIGLYKTDLVRSGDQGLSAESVPAAHLVTFDSDAPFAEWQNQPLSWNERAKIWVDNERDLLHIVRRVRHGQIVAEDRPLAPTNEGQRTQIEQLVAELNHVRQSRRD